MLSIPQLLIGFSDNQISHVLDNCDKMFTVSDVKAMLKYGKKVFKDVHEGEVKDLDRAYFFDDLDEDNDDEWNDLLETLKETILFPF